MLGFHLYPEKGVFRLRQIAIMLALLFLLTACQSTVIVKKETIQNTTSANISEALPVNETNATSIVLSNIQVFIPREGNLTVYFLDVQGSSTILQYRDKSVLIDSGFESDSPKVLKSVRDLGIERLDYIFATNTQPKNIGGMPYLIMRTEPKNVVENGIPSTLKSYKAYKELYNNTIVVTQDTLFSLREISVKAIVIYDDGNGFSTNLDDNSIVTMARFGNSNFLFMSDCGLDCEERLKNTEVSADILKISNSCNSTSLAFLQRVNPKVAIVSANIDFCPSIKDRFKFLDIPLYITSEVGDIYVTTDGLDYKIDYGKNG